MTKESESPKRIIMTPSEEMEGQIAFLMKETGLSRTNAVRYAVNRAAKAIGYLPKKGK